MQRSSSSLLVSTCLVVLLAIPAVAGAEPPGTTPEQPYFEWTRMPFPKEVYQRRIARLVEVLEASGGGVFLVPGRPGRSHGETFRQNEDFLYLTGLELPDALLAVDADEKRAILFLPERDARFESAARPNDFPGRALLADKEIARRSGLSDLRPLDKLDEALDAWVEKRRLLRLNPGRGGELGVLETGFFYHWNGEERLLHHLRQRYPKARIENAYAAIARLRMVKSPEEIAVLRRAAEITAAGIRRAATFVRPGATERTLEAELEAEFKRRGSQRLAFASIIKSGPNSLWPWRILAAHYDRRNRAMEDGDLVIFDVGCEVDYYASDVGRTFPVNGTFTAFQKKTLETTTAVADAIIAAVKPGVTFGELREIAVLALPESERSYTQTGSFFGHHVGLNVGDPNLLEARLEPGMVFTVEPWYYNHHRDIAVFVEDMILVTSGGRENLTRGLPRSPAGLEKMMKSETP